MTSIADYPCLICGAGRRKGAARGLCATCYIREWRKGFPSGAEPWQLSFKQHWDVMVKRPGECWIPEKKPHRYGYVSASQDGVRRLGHDLAYETFVGPIPPGRVLDHLCHTRDTTCEGGVTCPHRACWNPSHLEPVTSEENFARGRGSSFAAARKRAARTHCVHGHPWTADNLHTRKSGVQECRTCMRVSSRHSKRKTRGSGGRLAAE